MAKGTNGRDSQHTGAGQTRYGATVVMNKYPLDPDADGRGATSPIPANEMPVGPGKNDTAAQMEYLAAQRGG